MFWRKPANTFGKEITINLDEYDLDDSVKSVLNETLGSGLNWKYLKSNDNMLQSEEALPSQAVFLGLVDFIIGQDGDFTNILMLPSIGFGVYLDINKESPESRRIASGYAVLRIPESDMAVYLGFDRIKEGDIIIYFGRLRDDEKDSSVKYFKHSTWQVEDFREAIGHISNVLPALINYREDLEKNGYAFIKDYL